MATTPEMDPGQTAGTSSSGNTEARTSMGSPSVPLDPRRSAAKKPGGVRQRRGRKAKANAETLLAIAQSALARLGEAEGIKVYARSEGGVIVVTIVGAKIDSKKFVVDAII